MKTRKNSNVMTTLLCIFMLNIFSTSTMAATSTIFLEQSGLTGASDTLKAVRVPIWDSSGKIKYFDIVIKFEIDAQGIPVIADTYPVISPSPLLTVGNFKAGNYKDVDGNVYNVSGPGAASGGRTTWAIQLTKRAREGILDSLSGSWTTGEISGHPIESILEDQGITSTAYSWGSITSNISPLKHCDGRAIGVAQSGNLLTINGYCSPSGDNKQSGVLTLSLDVFLEN